VYEGGIRVPLLIRWPGVTKPGTVSDEPVLAVDYAPTLAAAAGVSTAPRMDGLNITPALRGKKLPRRALYWHYPHYSPQLGRPAAAVRQGDYKLIRFFEEERVELYNLRSDIGEAQDLTKVEARRAAEMNAALSAWLRDTGAKLPTPNPAYDAAREMLPGPPMGPVPEK
jgi:arylsulfatase A-like enzyme